VFTLVPDVANKLYRIKYRHVEAREGGSGGGSKEDDATQEEIIRERQHCVSLHSTESLLSIFCV
jgi:hypothetical protein